MISFVMYQHCFCSSAKLNHTLSLFQRSPLMVKSFMWRTSDLSVATNQHRHHLSFTRHPNNTTTAIHRGIRIQRRPQSQQQQLSPQQQQKQPLRLAPPPPPPPPPSTKKISIREISRETELRERAHRDWFFHSSNLPVLLFRLLAAGGILHLVTEYGFEIIICEGSSMYPTIHPKGDVILVDKLTPRIYGIQGGSTEEERTKLARSLQENHDRRNDKGVWHEPRIPVDKIPTKGCWTRFLKRQLSGVSVGDVVVVKHIYREGTVCKRILGLPGDAVNNPPLEVRRSLAWKSKCQGNTLLVIPDGHMWLEGDNSGSSVDSRIYGPVPVNLLVGRVVARIWPLRGGALMERGAQPSSLSRGPYATTIFPAGYQGQEIVKDDPNNAVAR